MNLKNILFLLVFIMMFIVSCFKARQDVISDKRWVVYKQISYQNNSQLRTVINYNIPMLLIFKTGGEGFMNSYSFDWYLDNNKIFIENHSNVDLLKSGKYDFVLSRENRLILIYQNTKGLTTEYYCGLPNEK